MLGSTFETLVNIMAALRREDGCPWDREQTHETLKPYLLEEAYEVLESIDNRDPGALKEELGDLMLQSVFHAQIASESSHFTMQDVLETITEKLIRRHPHVFGDTVIHTAEEQKIHWEKLKKNEGKKSVVDGVPVHAPALLRAYRVQQKAATVGFDWDHIGQVWKKVEEEIQELHDEIEQKNPEAVNEEFGDLLFALVNVSRFIHVHPEDALRRATDKFIQRFQKVESRFREKGRDLRTATLEEMDKVWNEIKKES
ncbi:nucleoside triphosphate pyrophosphohydrolase [bacterium]|nr:nucleoside triphosphate pyrophosphohydrolase [bacterium]